MIITDDDMAIAHGRAEALLRGGTEDARWNVLRDALVESNSKERESMLANLTLDAVRDLLYPGSTATDGGSWDGATCSADG